jgi:hypothetical protein
VSRRASRAFADLDLQAAVPRGPGVLDVREPGLGGQLLDPGGADAEDAGGLAGAAPVRVPTVGSVPLQRGGFDGLELQPAMLMLDRLASTPLKTRR